MPQTLEDLLAELEAVAPLHLAEAWDNVGLLLDPRGQDALCARLLLTIDYTWPVLEEAVEHGVDVVVAYHPVIFGGVRRLRHGVAGERLLLETLRRNIVVYSPHTALDAARDGMTDWLAQAIGPGSTRPIVPAPPRGTDVAHLQPSGEREGSPPAAREGQGRLVSLDTAVALDSALEALKSHLRLSQVRLAAASRHVEGEPIRTLAVCPGAGGKLFEGVRDVDLLLTGEMRHHDVLAHNARGTSVVLCDHTNTERGFLPVLAERLRQRLADVEVLVSQRDADPLRIV